MLIAIETEQGIIHVNPAHVSELRGSYRATEICMSNGNVYTTSTPVQELERVMRKGHY